MGLLPPTGVDAVTGYRFYGVDQIEPGRLIAARFSIYWGESCRPVPDEEAEELATRCPELTLRTEPAHLEAFLNVGPGRQASAVQWQLVSESLQT